VVENPDSNKAKIALKIGGHWVSLLSKENKQFLPQLKNTL